MFPLSLSVLLGWTEVVKTQSRRQSVLVCSLLVVSLLLSAAVGGDECARGFPSSDTIDMYGPSSMSAELPSTNNSILYAFPSMNFSCDGTITDVRMRMDYLDGVQPGQKQYVFVYFVLFHNGLNSPTREVSCIFLKRDNTVQEVDSRHKFTEILKNRSPLSLRVTEGTFIGIALPGSLSSGFFTKTINLMPTSDRVEAQYYQLTANFSEFEGQMLEAARTADSSQFTTKMLPLPLIDVSFSPGNSTGLSSSPTPISSGTTAPISAESGTVLSSSATQISSGISAPISTGSSIGPSPSPTKLTPSPLSHSSGASSSITTTHFDYNPTGPTIKTTYATTSPQLMVIVMAAVVGNVILMLVLVVVVVAMVTVLCRKWSKIKEHFYTGNDTSTAVGLQATNNSIESYYEPMSSAQNPAHFHHHPHPLHSPQLNIIPALDNTDRGDYISMQECPAYQPIEVTSTSGDVSYI